MKLTEDLKQQQVQQFAVTIWTIWNNRNGELHGEERKTSLAAINFVREYMVEYNQAQWPANGGMTMIQQRWKPPGIGLYKVNFDGALEKG